MSNNTTESGLSEDGATNDHVLRVSFFIEASAIILANLLTIITFSINRHLRKRSMYCVINLAVADMLFGIEVILKSTFSWKKGKIAFFLKHNSNEKSWTDVIHAFVVTQTVWSLALVAVERMCATVWPLRHRNARSWAYTLAISMTWTAAVISGTLSSILMETTVDHTTLSKIEVNLRGPAMFLLVGIICVSYIVIFIKVKKQQQQMAGQRVPRRDQRLVMTLCIMTMASIATWIPLALVSMLTAKGVIVASYDVLGGIILLATCNALINPIIYVFRMRDFRKALLRLILTCSRDRPTQVVPQPN